jgi:hypothetical protein
VSGIRGHEEAQGVLNVTMARAVVRDEDRVVHSGFADVEMGAKWAVFREEPHDPAFGLTVEPTLVTPTIAHRVSDEAWALELPITAGRSFGRFALDGELAYEHVFNGDEDEVSVLQGLLGRSLTTEAGRHLTQAKLVVEYAFH